MTEQNAKNVEIYLDYATVPTLHYFYHFVKNSNDKETIRLFGLGRFSIAQEIIDAYPQGIIRFVPAFSGDQQQFNQLFESLLKECENTKYNLKFHINLFHSWNMLIPLLHIVGKYRHKVSNILLNFYDDGSEGVVTLFDISQKYSKENLIEIIDTDIQSFYADTLAFLDPSVARYLWNTLFESHYYLINDSILQNEKLSYLKDKIKYYHLLKLDKYINLSTYEKELFNQLLGINIHKLTPIIEKFKENKIFLFTGTTIFNLPKESEQAFYHLHINAILNYIHQNGKYFIGKGFLLCIKGHPHQKQLNQRLKESFQNVLMLPDNIPFEILYLLGCKPEKIGGFVSTSYFSCDKDRIADLIFMSTEDAESRGNNDLFNTQYQLRDVMIKLGYITPEKAHFYSDIPTFIA
nr:hypothetical protein [uncultured Haemophilus sp.]